jgi:hypothetical protein
MACLNGLCEHCLPASFYPNPDGSKQKSAEVVTVRHSLFGLFDLPLGMPFWGGVRLERGQKTALVVSDGKREILTEVCAGCDGNPANVISTPFAHGVSYDYDFDYLCSYRVPMRGKSEVMPLQKNVRAPIATGKIFEIVAIGS